MTRVDQNVDFNWVNGSPAANVIPNDGFFARWSGYFTAPKAGIYNFGARHDDAMRITVGGVDQYVSTGTCATSCYDSAKSVTLAAGQTVPIEATLTENLGSSQAQLYVKGAVYEQVIPTDWLQTGVRPVTQGSGLTGRYYRDPGLTKDFAGAGVALMMQRVDPLISFNWGDQSPVPNGPTDRFMIRWEGYITAPEAGTYEFGGGSDDGYRVTVGTTQVADFWTDNPGTARWSGTGIALAANTPTYIKVDYYENGGGASMNLLVKKTGMAEQIVTVAYAVVDASRDRLTLALAGHPAPILATTGSVPVQLDLPAKDYVLAWKPGDVFDRRVRSVVLDADTGAVTEVVISLDTEQVLFTTDVATTDHP
jgi:hypothetical protein